MDRLTISLSPRSFCAVLPTPLLSWRDNDSNRVDSTNRYGTQAKPFVSNKQNAVPSTSFLCNLKPVNTSKGCSYLLCPLQTVDSKLQCTQRHGTTVMEEVNCTEIISMVPLSGSTGVVKTQTISTLTLLRAQKGTPSGVGEYRLYCSVPE